MKRVLFALFSFILVLGLVLVPAGKVNAALGDDPVVTPVSGDLEFTTGVVTVPNLPGTLLLPSQMYGPVGFPIGEAQFYENGIRVTGMEFGKAVACFTIANTFLQKGWKGAVGVWNGTNWVTLSTTLTTGEELPYTMACAPISGDGTYAFIMGVADPALLVTACDTSGWGLGTAPGKGGDYFYAYLPNLGYGTPATLTFISADPESNYNGFDDTADAYVGSEYPGYADFYSADFTTEGEVLVTLRVTAGGCSKDLQIEVSSEEPDDEVNIPTIK